MFWINRKYFSTATEFFFMLKVVRKEVNAFKQAAKTVSKVARNAKDKVTAVLDFGSMDRHHV